jgi:hypothetical protein
MTDDPLAKIIKPIVEGQIRSFLHAHPVIADAVDWRHSHDTKTEALVSSIAKRVSRDLLCPQTRGRIKAAMEALTVVDQPGVELMVAPAGVEDCLAPNAPDLPLAVGPAADDAYL